MHVQAYTRGAYACTGHIVSYLLQGYVTIPRYSAPGWLTQAASNDNMLQSTTSGVTSSTSRSTWLTVILHRCCYYYPLISIVHEVYISMTTNGAVLRVWHGMTYMGHQSLIAATRARRYEPPTWTQHITGAKTHIWAGVLVLVV